MPKGRSGGSSSAQISCAYGQRVRKRQPEGGVIADGSSPLTAAPRPGAGEHRVGHRDRLDQPAGVRMDRLGVDRLGGTDLDELAQVHDGDRVGEVPDDGEVVRDDDVGEPVRRLQRLHQVEDLRLDRDVERRDRLVGDDQLRIERERAGEADPLALAARELVRVELGRLRREPDLVEQLGDPGVALAGRAELWTTSGSRRIAEPTRIRGSSEAYGSWNISCRSRRRRRSCRPRSRACRRPRSGSSPPVGRSSAEISQPIVVLPQPDSPTSPNVSPRRTVNETSETALTEPSLRWMTAPDGDRELLREVVELEHDLAAQPPAPPRRRAGGELDAAVMLGAGR